MAVKKRILVCLLLVVLVIGLFPGVEGISPLCFVGNNDSIPLELSGGENPFYSQGALYIPYNAFEANPNGVGVAYNPEKDTLVLFNANQTLIYDLRGRTYVDSKENSYEADVIYRGGVMYIPASIARHFGLSVTLLFSRYGYPIIRFTDGSQVYDDGTFVAQAENLIDRAVTKYEQNNGSGQQNTGSMITNPGYDPLGQDNPVKVYPAFVGEAVSPQTLAALASLGARAAFFLTEEQILEQRDLVRAIYAAGHTVGLTVPRGTAEPQAVLQQANDALDQVLFYRTVFTLIPWGTTLPLEQWCTLQEPAVKTPEQILSVTATPQLFVIRSGAAEAITALAEGGAALLCLRETTFG